MKPNTMLQPKSWWFYSINTPGGIGWGYWHTRETYQRGQEICGTCWIVPKRWQAPEEKTIKNLHVIFSLIEDYDEQQEKIINRYETKLNTLQQSCFLLQDDLSTIKSDYAKLRDKFPDSATITKVVADSLRQNPAAIPNLITYNNNTPTNQRQIK